MNKPRHIIFFALVAGAIIGTIGAPFSVIAAFLTIGCLVGLQIWAFIFLSFEPKLARIALLFVIVGLLILFFAVALSPST
jgi:hypothetical protein